MTFMLVMLGEKFGPSPQSSHGALMPIAVEPIDSIPIGSHCESTNQPWAVDRSRNAAERRLVRNRH
jgi:hypothetical protein